MDATPSFGVTMISEVPSDPQLTLVRYDVFNDVCFLVILKKKMLFFHVLSKTLRLIPTLKNCKKIAGVAIDGNLKSGESNLASSTLLQDENSKDIFGMVISYTAKIKLFLGAIGGELSAELPFILMHPKPNMKRILKADTMADNDFKASLDDLQFEDFYEGKNKDV